MYESKTLPDEKLIEVEKLFSDPHYLDKYHERMNEITKPKK
jgi:hypothetical protein